jgi:hypothetical protein
MILFPLFSTGVVDTGGAEIQNDPNVIFRGVGPEANNLVTLSFETVHRPDQNPWFNIRNAS